jgi:hypothetical protein
MHPNKHSTGKGKVHAIPPGLELPLQLIAEAVDDYQYGNVEAPGGCHVHACPYVWVGGSPGLSLLLLVILVGGSRCTCAFSVACWRSPTVFLWRPPPTHTPAETHTFLDAR